jgi:diacylglycerol kinase family enzyme
MEVASGLAGTRIPMAILPGGTANVMALELKIPNDLVAACALAVNPDALVRAVDIGQVEGRQGKHSFLLRASTGLEAAMVEGADRDQKDRLGVFAYALSGLQALADPTAARYHLILDGKQVEAEGLACVVANSGAMGASGVLAAYIAPEIDVSDGLLDVLVITRVDLPGLLSLVTSMVAGSENSTALQRWKAREVEIVADPPQSVQVDGEILEQTPIRVRVNARAVRVIVPAEALP